MCRAWLTAVGAAALAAAVSSSPLTAQDLAHLERLVERRAEAWRAAQARADSLLRLEPYDTVTAGPLIVAAPRASIGRMQEAMQLALPLLDSVLGTDIELLAPVTIVAREGGIGVPRPEAERGAAVVGLNFDEEDGAREIADRLVSAAAEGLFRRLPASLQSWVGSALFFPALRRDRPDLAYQQLATQPSRVARDCFTGRLDACAAALGLVDVDDPIMAWYDSADRRRLAEGCWACSRKPGFGDCLAGSDRACAAVLRDGGIPQPLDHNVRISVLRTALTEGGDGAYRRLVQPSDADVAERLAAVGHMPLDSLLASWRDRIMRSRPARPTVKRSAMWTALLWVLAFAAMGFRSTRWR